MTHTQKRIIINNVVMVLSTLSALVGIGFLFKGSASAVDA